MEGIGCVGQGLVGQCGTGVIWLVVLRGRVGGPRLWVPIVYYHSATDMFLETRLDKPSPLGRVRERRGSERVRMNGDGWGVVRGVLR